MCVKTAKQCKQLWNHCHIVCMCAQDGWRGWKNASTGKQTGGRAAWKPGSSDQKHGTAAWKPDAVLKPDNAASWKRTADWSDWSRDSSSRASSWKSDGHDSKTRGGSNCQAKKAKHAIDLLIAEDRRDLLQDVWSHMRKRWPSDA
jgi:hypothetical protein